MSEAVDGVNYVQVAAGFRQTVLLRSDLRVVACGSNERGQYDLPEAEDGVNYVQVAAGWADTVLLRRDGRMPTCGDNFHGQCDLPEAEDGVRYTQVAAENGVDHTDSRRTPSLGGLFCRVLLFVPLFLFL